MWALYEDGTLYPETILTGLFEDDAAAADVDSVLEDIKAVLAEEEARLERLRDNESLE
jgi:RIO kinase 1